jgi:hypothetical protein
VTAGTAWGLVAAGGAAAVALFVAARRGSRADVLLDERQHRQAEVRARYFNEVGDSAGF